MDSRPWGTPRPLLVVAGLACLAGLAAGCATPATAWPTSTPPEAVLDARRERVVSFGEMAEDLASVRMVFVGESHTNPEHHRIQLRILEALAARRPHLLVGMEMIERPFQPVLDRWSAGELDEPAFLREVNWYGQWSDWDLYGPILRFARDRGIRVVALNCDRDFIRAIGRGGLDGISPWMRARLPADIDTGVKPHEDAIREVFPSHPGMAMSEERFRRFYEAQCTWDETMAESAASALEESPHADAAIVVLAGSMHLEGFHAIPERARKRNGLDYRVVLPVERGSVPPKGVKLGPGRSADYLLATGPTPSGPSVVLGVALRGGDSRVRTVVPGSPAAGAGLREGDDLVSVSGFPVADLVDLRLALEEIAPGDRVAIAWLRDGTAMEGVASFVPPPDPAEEVGGREAAPPPAGDGGGTGAGR